LQAIYNDLIRVLNMKIPFSKIPVLLILITTVYSCNKNDAELTFGEKYINARTSLTLIDTFTVEFSTIRLDSIQTSNTNTILVGHYQDQYFGEIYSTSFIELTSPTVYDVGSNEVYDSVALILNYANYYGDTTQQFSLTVHQLTAKIEPESEDTYLYNTSSVSYNLREIGSKQFYPKPFSKDSLLTIKLNDVIGEYLFNGLKDNNDEVILSEKFLENFKGLAIVSDKFSNNAILGFLAENVTMRIYSHENNIDEDAQYYDFPISTITSQFNRIEHNYSETLFSSIRNQKDELKSGDAYGLSYIQAGTALATKVKFPYIEELLLNNEGIILKADLVFVPKKLSYTGNELPTDLVLYKIGKHNVISNQYYTTDDVPITSLLVEDDIYQENTYYSFDVSSYILNGIENHYFNPDDALLISFNSSDIKTNFNKVLIDTEVFTPQLRLYLLKY